MQGHRWATGKLERLAAGALVVALGAGAAACSSSSPNSSGTTTTASASGPSNKSSSPGCGLVSAAEVNAALGTNVGSPSAQPNGSVTVCTYTSSSPIATVIVRFQTGMSMSDFATARAQFDQHGETTTSVSGLGDAAYSSSAGTGQYQQNTIVVLKGSTELLITAPASLDQVEALARQVLPSI
ncbi:MAG: hypothetical protein ACYDA2_02645 [Acidimicrobiales bacterium]